MHRSEPSARAAHVQDGCARVRWTLASPPWPDPGHLRSTSPRPRRETRRMTRERVRTSLAEAVVRALVAGDVLTLQRMVHPDVLDHSAQPGQPAGWPGVRERAMTLCAAMPESEVSVDVLSASGDTVLARAELVALRRDLAAATTSPSRLTVVAGAALRRRPAHRDVDVGGPGPGPAGHPRAAGAGRGVRPPARLTRPNPRSRTSLRGRRRPRPAPRTRARPRSSPVRGHRPARGRPRHAGPGRRASTR